MKSPLYMRKTLFLCLPAQFKSNQGFVFISGIHLVGSHIYNGYLHKYHLLSRWPPRINRGGFRFSGNWAAKYTP